MPGTAAGARKGWKVRRAETAKAAKPRRTLNQVMKNAVRLAEIQAQDAAKGSGFVSGLNIRLQKIDEEYVPALATLPERLKVYQQMGNDAKIKAQIRANILPILSSVRKKVVGGTQEQRDLISQNLLREGDPRYWCDTSWNQRMLEKMMALHYGFTIHGKTWDVVDGYSVIRSLTYLHPKSMGGPLGAWEWDKETKRLVAIHRHYRLSDGSQVVDERIPVEDLDACVWWQTGENWEGESLLRSMYGAWVKKDLASKIGMIALMNGGVGIPMATLAPNDGTVAQNTLKQMAADLRGGSKERQFLMLANGQKMEFLTTNGTIVDARPVIDVQNMDIASGGATDFLQAGQTASGSRAGGSVMMVAYMQQLQGVNVWLQEQVNHGSGYLQGTVEELIYKSFGPVKECPHIEFSPVSPADQIDNLTLLGDLTQKGVIPRTLKVANYALDRLTGMEMTQDEFDKAVGGRSVVDVGTPSGQPEAGDPTKANGGAGRPNSATPIDRNEPRNDKMGRAFGLTDTPAEKKTSDGPPLPRRTASYPWLRSTPA